MAQQGVRAATTRTRPTNETTQPSHIALNGSLTEPSAAITRNTVHDRINDDTIHSAEVAPPKSTSDPGHPDRKAAH
jgi:hypothetical protein